MLFKILIGILAICVLQALGLGVLFFFKRSGVKRANYFYGLLLITFGLTLLHNIFSIVGFFEKHQSLNYLPIYYTLAFPTLLFYYVKLNLYPGYRLKWTDSKHFVLPIGQFLFFFIVSVFALDPMGRDFYNPFFGAFEQFLYLLTFFSYLYFSYRYISQKKKEAHSIKDRRKIKYLRILIQTLFFLFFFHALFIVSDFLSYELLGVNLRTIKPYVGLGILSFAALIFWLGIYGFQVLFWGRRAF